MLNQVGGTTLPVSGSTNLIDNPRLQHLREQMQAFNFKVKWAQGKMHLIADTLSHRSHFSPHAEE